MNTKRYPARTMEVTAARRTGSRVAGWALAAALAVTVGAGAVLLLRPAGRSTAAAAAIAAADSAADTPTVLVSRPWGAGRLVVTAFTDARGRRLIGLAFAIDRGRGWRVSGYTEEPASDTDVAVGSLLVASSPGGADQPAWSAAYGELSDARVAGAEVVWEDGTSTRAVLEGRAYLAVRPGEGTATEVRYLRRDGSVLARVPV